jgi:hypothetical protein
MTTQPYEHPRWGTEFDWLAVDSVGCVALLSSAGYGPVPHNVAQQEDLVDAAVDEAEHLPTVGAAIEMVARQPTGDHSDWYQAAARGFYAYDWTVWDGPYERLAVPTRPVHAAELPPSVREAAQLIRFSITFAEAGRLTLNLITQ